jgi:Dual OB-containing domain
MIERCGIEGDWPEVLDVVRIEIDQPRPLAWQPENWSLTGRPWERLDHLDPAHAVEVLQGLLNYDVTLLQSTKRKIAGDYLQANPIEASLTLAQPDQLQWRIEEPPWGGRQEKALFSANGRGQYDFHVTDFPIEEALHRLGFGVHPRAAVGIDDRAELYLTISLGDPYNLNNDCYKLAAAVTALPS